MSKKLVSLIALIVVLVFPARQTIAQDNLNFKQLIQAASHVASLQSSSTVHKDSPIVECPNIYELIGENDTLQIESPYLNGAGWSATIYSPANFTGQTTCDQQNNILLKNETIQPVCLECSLDKLVPGSRLLEDEQTPTVTMAQAAVNSDSVGRWHISELKLLTFDNENSTVITLSTI